jgi:mRNA interferase RelE/StbE
MKTIYLESFERDIKKIKEKKVKTNLLLILREIIESNDIQGIQNLKKIKGVKKFYRIKMGNSRLGIKIEETTVTFIRFLHRKDIYRYFP